MTKLGDKILDALRPAVEAAVKDDLAERRASKKEPAEPTSLPHANPTPDSGPMTPAEGRQQVRGSASGRPIRRPAWGRNDLRK